MRNRDGTGAAVCGPGRRDAAAAAAAALYLVYFVTF